MWWGTCAQSIMLELGKFPLLNLHVNWYHILTISHVYWDCCLKFCVRKYCIVLLESLSKVQHQLQLTLERHTIGLVSQSYHKVDYKCNQWNPVLYLLIAAILHLVCEHTCILLNCLHSTCYVKPTCNSWLESVLWSSIDEWMQSTKALQAEPRNQAPETTVLQEQFSKLDVEMWRGWLKGLVRPLFEVYHYSQTCNNKSCPC